MTGNGETNGDKSVARAENKTGGGAAGPVEVHYEQLFRRAEISIWIEDFSPILEEFDRLRAEGVTNLRQYLASNPDEALKMAEMVKVIDVNDATLKLFEAETKQQFLTSITDVFSSATTSVFTEEMCTIWERKKTTFRAQMALQTLHGRKLTAIITLPIPVTPEEFSNVPVSILDITDYVETQTALRQSEKTYRNLLTNLKSGVAMHAPDTSVLISNPAASRILGLSEAQMLGKQAIDPQWKFLREDGSELPLEEYPVNQVLSKNAPLHNLVLGVNRPKFDDIAWMLVDGFSVFKPSGELDHIIITFVDITDLKKAEAGQKRLMSAIEQASDSIMITGKDTLIQYVNPAFERITGYEREEVLGLNPSFLKSGEQDKNFFPRMWQKLTAGKTWNGRMINKRKDGTLYTEEVAISPMFDRSGQTVNYVAVKRDITNELALRSELNQAQKMEAVGRLAGGIAHDFNNMLGVIIGYADLILDQAGPEHPHYGYVSEIKKAGERSADLTQQLLAFARKQTVAPKVIDLNETVIGMTTMLKRLIGESIDLTWEPGNDLWPVKVDPVQIDQILANLCVNARDAIDGMGKVTIETDNTVIDEVYCQHHIGSIPGDYVLLAVSDNGNGMDPATLGNAFDPFFTTKDAGIGTGLGLATVYGAVKQSNGFINIYSEPGFGTTFKIYLPRHHSKEGQIREDEPDAQAAGGHETILLVEDEPAILRMIAVMLKSEGYNVIAAGSPGEAIELADAFSGAIHLLMTDVVMPEMNGRDLARRILSYYPFIKRLFMSGYTANVIAHHGVLYEGVNFIQKPFSILELNAKVREVLEQSEDPA